ncbi:MAG: hypothetical protein KGH53_01730 [Candidatus Micrarchaeota archaeon]|nr:hypothetical protein [Candidatus Micrarchaeota archaeon]
MLGIKKKEHVLVELAGKNSELVPLASQIPQLKAEYLRLKKEVLKIKGVESLSYGGFYSFPMTVLANWPKNEIVSSMRELKAIKGIADAKFKILIPIKPRG